MSAHETPRQPGNAGNLPDGTTPGRLGQGAFPAEHAWTFYLRRYDAHKAHRAYLAAKRDRKASRPLRRAWVLAKARLVQAEAWL